RVHEDSPADEAGIRAGWHIERFGRVGADVLIEIAGQASGVERPETTAALIFTSRLAGNVGSTLELTVRDGSETASVVSLELAPAPGELASLGNLPPLPVVVETRTLDDGVGYFRINVFFDPPRVLSAYRAFLAEHADAPGIVIDMRGNLGGIILMASGMMNFLIDESGLKLGEMTLRDPERGPFAMPIMLNPRGSTYDGKVAVLIDEQSISNAEILAAGLQDIGRARLFGTRTAGLVLPSTVDLLPNGDGFQFAFASYVSSSGRPLEGVGAAPDVAVQETAQGLLAGVDGPLDAALDWILGGE
ncbi:MAG: S41 family peptidase, partial [Planctomycetota bacterium]